MATKRTAVERNQHGFARVALAARKQERDEARAEAALYLSQWWRLVTAAGFPDATDFNDADGEERTHQACEAIAASATEVQRLRAQLAASEAERARLREALLVAIEREHSETRTCDATMRACVQAERRLALAMHWGAEAAASTGE